MSEIFPRLSSILNGSNGVTASPVVHSIEAIKSELLAKILTLPTKTPLKAEVIAKMSDGSYVANVEEIPLRLTLPSTVKIGDRLNLSLLQSHPRPLFALDGNNPVSLVETYSPVASHPEATSKRSPSQIIDAQLRSNTSSDVPQKQPTLTVASHTQALERSPSTVKEQLRLEQNQGHFLKDYHAFASMPASSEIQLSETAQIIGTVLRDTDKAPQGLSIKSSTPLIDDITAQAKPRSLSTRLAAQMHQQIEHSGVFYESHVAQWANGERQLEELKQEPQAKIALAFESTVLTDQNNKQHLQLSEIVHQQLDIAESASLKWQGNLSPSIPMSMQIQKEFVEAADERSSS
ncbi:MAG: hypothetical protein E6Q34_05240, partial [Burkholderiaceae bacterium]